MESRRRMQIAHRVAENLRRRHGRRFLGVGVYGSVARGEARAHSDVDMLAVLRGSPRRSVPRIVDGILVTVLFESPEEARSEVAEPRADLFDTIAGWRTMRAIYDPRGLLAALRRRSRHPSRQLFRESAREALYGAAEDLGKLRNAVEAGDAADAREMAIWFSGAAVCALLNLRHKAVTGRRAFVVARRLDSAGDAIWRLRYGSVAPGRAWALAARTWSRLLDLAEKNGMAVAELSALSP